MTKCCGDDQSQSTSPTSEANPLNVVSAEAWIEERKKLLVREKEFSRQRDALAAERRRLPVVKLNKSYTFDGPNGQENILSLFGQRRQLIVYHFMFDPQWDDGCPHCSQCADTFNGIVSHLAARDTAFCAVSRAPMSKIVPFKERMNWTFPWYSSFVGDFNYDFGVTLDKAVKKPVHNYKDAEEMNGENSGISSFLRVDDAVYHTYSSYERGLDLLIGTYNYLDITFLGRQEGKRPTEYPQEWVRHRDRYEV